MSSFSDEIIKLKEKVAKARLPIELEEKANGLLDRLSHISEFGGYSQEFESVA